MIDSLDTDNVIKCKETNNDLTIYLQAFQHWFRENLRLELGFTTFLMFELYCLKTNAMFIRSAFLRVGSNVHGSPILCLLFEKLKNKQTTTNSVALVRKRTVPTERPTFAGRGCYVVSATDSHGR
jgi:hypothetical protein